MYLDTFQSMPDFCKSSGFLVIKVVKNSLWFYPGDWNRASVLEWIEFEINFLHLMFWTLKLVSLEVCRPWSWWTSKLVSLNVGWWLLLLKFGDLKFSLDSFITNLEECLYCRTWGLKVDWQQRKLFFFQIPFTLTLNLCFSLPSKITVKFYMVTSPWRRMSFVWI